jgi:CheY-like chemotaxis protein
MKEDKNPVILVIDDSNTNVVLLEAVLNGMGYNIESAMSVKEANQIIAKQLPDLILLDLLMPKVNGYDFLEQIKSDDLTKDIPVLIISAVTEPDNIRKTLKMGAVDFIKKPVDIQQLIEKVKTILAN